MSASGSSWPGRATVADVASAGRSLRDVPVLVTGADGFIGSHLVERLVADGARVRAFCIYNSRGSAGWLDDLDPATRAALDIRLGDIRDARFVERATEGIEVVFHLAALIAIPYSYTAVESFIDTNVRGTMHVLEAAARAGVRRIVQTSTSEVYGTPDTLPIRETHPLQAQSPYAASKVAADQLVLAYHRSFGAPAVVLRPFNTYGPRQSDRAVLPTMLRQLLAGRTEIRLGRLDPRRDLTFVGDTVDGFIRAATVDGIEGQTIQLGTGRAESIGELFELACRVVGVAASAVEDPARLRPDASEVLVLCSDPARARDLLGWEARTSLEDGIAATVDWLRGQPDRGEADRVQV
jgi:NAD dependent epimerase/dehydratase